MVKAAPVRSPKVTKLYLSTSFMLRHATTAPPSCNYYFKYFQTWALVFAPPPKQENTNTNKKEKVCLSLSRSASFGKKTYDLFKSPSKSAADAEISGRTADLRSSSAIVIDSMLTRHGANREMALLAIRGRRRLLLAPRLLRHDLSLLLRFSQDCTPIRDREYQLPEK